MNEENTIFNKKFYLQIFGLALILISSLYIFTRPAFWDDFDFSETGQIGDTIGGITAPIINLVGAVLVFISFKAQINANKIQFKLLSTEIENQNRDRNFQVILDLFQALKNDVRNITHNKYSGLGALNFFVNEIKDTWTKEKFQDHIGFPAYSDWKFILAQYDLITYHLETSELRDPEKVKLKILVKNYYSIQLSYPTNILKTQLEKFEVQSDALIIISTISKFNSAN